MLESVQGLVKGFSILLLIIIEIISCIKCNGKVKNQVTTGLITGGLSLVIIYLLNI